MQELYQKLKKDHPDIFGKLAFDGRKNIYSSTRLPFQGDRQEYQVQLREGGGPAAGGRAPKVYHVRFTKTHQEIIPEYVTTLCYGCDALTTNRAHYLGSSLASSLGSPPMTTM